MPPETGSVPYSEFDETDVELTATIDLIRGSRPIIPNLYRMLLHRPALANRWVSLANALRFEGSIADRDRELVILQVAAHTRCGYERHHHEPLGLAAGLSPDELEDVRLWSEGEWSERDRALLGYVSSVVFRDPVDESGRELLRDEFGDPGMVELTALIAYYVSVATFLIAMDIQIEGGG